MLRVHQLVRSAYISSNLAPYTSPCPTDLESYHNMYPVFKKATASDVNSTPTPQHCSTLQQHKCILVHLSHKLQLIDEVSVLRTHIIKGSFLRGKTEPSRAPF